RRHAPRVRHGSHFSARTSARWYFLAILTRSRPELLPANALAHSHMRAKSRVSRWLRAAAVLVVAECIGVTSAPAQFSGDLFHFNASHHRSEKYRENLCGPLGWEPPRRKAHRRSESSRASPRDKGGSKSKEDEPTAANTIVGDIPLPRPRPSSWPEPHSF